MAQQKYIRKLAELKARKAKFGFKFDGVGPSHYIYLGNVMLYLQNAHADNEYSVETSGMHGNDFRLYTDSEDLAKIIKQRFIEND